MPHSARAAAQSLNAIWITDDVLAEAFSRFARVCHYQHYTCRRHGSNIPGPLEARRRHARRRMGLAAAAAGNGPLPVDVGALFGLGARPPTNPEKSWRWEAPGLRQPTLGAGPPPPPLNAMREAWPLFTPPEKENPISPAVDPEQLLREAIQTSQAAFQDVLAALENQHTINKDDMTCITDFMHTSADEPKALNLLTLSHWLGDRTLTDGGIRALACCLRDKAGLRTLVEEEESVASILGILLERGHGATIESFLAETLDALPNDTSHTTVVQLSRFLRERMAIRPPPKAVVASVRLWFRILDSTQFMQSRRADHPVWRSVYQVFADVLKPQHLAAHFEKMEEADFAEVLLAYWVPSQYTRGDEKEQPQAIDYGTTTLLNLRPHAATGAAVKGHTKLVEDFVSSREQRRTDAVEKGDEQDYSVPLVDLLAVLVSHNIPYTGLLTDIFDTLKAQTSAADGVWRLFQALRRSRKVGIPTSIANSLVYYFMQRSHPPPHQPNLTRQPAAPDTVGTCDQDIRRAWLVFKSVPSLSVLQCLELPMKLVEHGYGTPDRIFLMLNRKIGPEIVLPEFRETARMALQPEHVDLVHLVAYAWATQEHSRSRVAFRRVWETYRFLQDRGAPLSVLMSRSLVKAGILRPLQEGKMVPVAQTKYIISLVQRLEGDEIARNLDRLVFEMNQKMRIPNYKYPEEGCASKWFWAGRTDEGIARAVRWRLQLWTRRKGRWYTAEGPVKREALSTEVEERDVLSAATLRKVAEDSAQHGVWRRELDRSTSDDGVDASEATAKDYFDGAEVDDGTADKLAVKGAYATESLQVQERPTTVETTQTSITPAGSGLEDVTTFEPFASTIKAPSPTVVPNDPNEGKEILRSQHSEEELQPLAVDTCDVESCVQDDEMLSQAANVVTTVPEANDTSDLSAVYAELSAAWPLPVITKAATFPSPTTANQVNLAAWEETRRQLRSEGKAELRQASGSHWQEFQRQKLVERRAKPPTSHFRRPEREVQAGAWQAFGLQWHKRRKRLGYDTHEKKFTG